MVQAGHQEEAQNNLQDFEKQLRWVDREALRLDRIYSFVLYNLACLEAMKGHRDQGLDYLSRSVAAGWSKDDVLVNDSDLEPLHGPEFDALVERARDKAKRDGGG